MAFYVGLPDNIPLCNMADEGSYPAGSTEPNIPTEAQISLNSFWPRVSEEIRNLQITEFRNQDLPLARIKKIMKLDEDVKMISAEAPLLFAKAAEIFISELSLRAWVHTEDNKRRTLQRNDIALAVSKYDQFDFLIDIVPREDAKPMKRETTGVGGAEQVQYYFQFPGQQAGTAVSAAQLAQPLQVQAQLATAAQPQQVGGAAQTSVAATSSAQHPVPLQQAQVFQQVVATTGEMTNVPIQLSEAQLAAIRQQMQNKQPGQPIVIQTQATPDQFTSATQQVQQQPATNIIQQASQGYFQSGETQNT